MNTESCSKNSVAKQSNSSVFSIFSLYHSLKILEEILDQVFDLKKLCQGQFHKIKNKTYSEK